MPLAQLVHVADEEAAIVGENLPAAQLVQTPPAAANLPAPQLVQSLPASDAAGEDLPAAQLVHDCAAMDAAANLPAAQLVHAAAPTDGLKLPAAQASHAPPLGPEKPGVHVHDANDALPDAEVAFAGQPVQTSELLAATITENLPAAHAWHAAEDEAPTVGENVPAPQSLHDCAAVDAAANLPAAQLVHTPPACAANLPAAQLVQSLPASDPAGEDLPAAQLMQRPPPTHHL